MHFIPEFWEEPLYQSLSHTQLMVHNKIPLSFLFVHIQLYKQLIEIFISKNLVLGLVTYNPW